MRTLLGGAAATAGGSLSIAARIAVRTRNMTRRDAFTRIPPSHGTNSDTRPLLRSGSAIQEGHCLARATASPSMSYGFARMPSNRWLLWSAITVSGNWRRQASVPRMDGWSAEDVVIPSADNFEDERGLGGGAVDHSRQTCHQPGQLPIVCHTVPDRHVPVAHPILSTASVRRSTEGRTAIH